MASEAIQKQIKKLKLKPGQYIVVKGKLQLTSKGLMELESRWIDNEHN